MRDTARGCALSPAPSCVNSCYDAVQFLCRACKQYTAVLGEYGLVRPCHALGACVL